MWEQCGVVRDEASLTRGSPARRAPRPIGDVDVRPSEEGWNDLAHVLDLRAGVAHRRSHVARRARPTRRPAGATTDPTYPDLDPAFRVNLRTGLDANQALLPVESEKVREIPADLEEWIARPWDVELGHRLLE